MQARYVLTAAQPKA